MLIVTGAAGFIGSNVVAALNEQGIERILAVDHAPVFEATGNLRGLRVAEALDRDAFLERLPNIKGIEGIVHLGACSDTTETRRDYIWRVNTDYTRTLWQHCTRFGIRFVYASSAATYGDGSNGYDDAADPRRLKPLNLYGESKHAFDLWALEQAETPPGWAGLKYFNVYGPREAHKGRMASVVLHSWRQIREGGRVRLFKSDRPGISDGGQQRDFVYVKDVVAATLHFLRAPAEKARGLFNVGTGQARSFADLATATYRALGLEPNIEYIPMPADLAGKYQYFTQATVERLRASGFATPFHSLEAGVADYVQNYLEKK